jgi:hypothetical protein
MKLEFYRQTPRPKILKYQILLKFLPVRAELFRTVRQATVTKIKVVFFCILAKAAENNLFVYNRPCSFVEKGTKISEIFLSMSLE